MNTLKRVIELAEERDLTLYKLAMLCDVSYSTLKNTQTRGGQLTVDTIERICLGLNPLFPRLYLFPDRKECWRKIS